MDKVIFIRQNCIFLVIWHLLPMGLMLLYHIFTKEPPENILLIYILVILISILMVLGHLSYAVLHYCEQILLRG